MPRGFMDDLEGKVIGEEVHECALEIDGLRYLWSFKFETPRQLSDGRYIDVIDLRHDQLLSIFVI